MKIIAASLLLLATTQTFAMGSKLPTTSNTQTTTPLTTTSSILTPLLGSLFPAASPGNALSDLIIPIIGGIGQNQGSTGSQGSAYVSQIESMVLDSTCSQISWRNKGTAPLSYMNGVAVNFAHNVCQLKNPNTITGTLLNTVLASALGKVQASNVFGKITSTEFANVPACNQLLTDIQDLVNNDQYACQDL